MTTQTAIDLDDIDVDDEVVLQDPAGNVAAGRVVGNENRLWIKAFGLAIPFAERSRKRGVQVAVHPTDWSDWRGVKGVRVVGHTSTLV